MIAGKNEFLKSIPLLDVRLNARYGDGDLPIAPTVPLRRCRGELEAREERKKHARSIYGIARPTVIRRTGGVVYSSDVLLGSVRLVEVEQV